MWKEFVENTQARVIAFNQAMGEDALGIKLDKPNEVIVGIHQFLSTVRARLENLSLKCSLVSTSAEYEINVVNGQVVFTTCGAHAHMREVQQIDGITERLINDIIKLIH